MERRHIARILILAVLSLVLSSCGMEQHLRVLKGNYAHGQGHFQNATVDYLRAWEEREYREWVAYNLGNVYYALGEVQAALGMWERAQESDEADILFGVTFNKGVFYYERGRYDDAYTQFKRALEIDPGSVDAKVNLELVLQKIQAREQVTRGDEPSGSDGEGEPTAQSIRILEYMRRKEETRWFATEEIEDESDTPAW